MAGFRIEQAHVEIRPLHLDALADPARRRRVVRRLDFDTAIEMYGAHAEAVVPKGFDGERLQGGLLLGKHGGHLTFGRAVDARVDLVDATRGEHRVVELAEHHREHVAKRPLEPADDIGARLRVLLDRVRDERMRELQQRGATTAEEHAEIATDLPRDRVRSEDPRVGILHTSRELRERCFEVGASDDRHWPSFSHPAGRACMSRRAHAPRGLPRKSRATGT